MNSKKFKMSLVVVIASACPLVCLYHSAYVEFQKEKKSTKSNANSKRTRASTKRSKSRPKKFNTSKISKRSPSPKIRIGNKDVK